MNDPNDAHQPTALQEGKTISSERGHEVKAATRSVLIPASLASFYTEDALPDDQAAYDLVYGRSLALSDG